MRAAQLRAQATVQASAVLIHTLTNLILIKLVVSMQHVSTISTIVLRAKAWLISDFTSLQITFSLGHASKPGIIRTILHAIN